MNQDQEHLRLLSLFHYVVAGLGALVSLLWPGIYVVLGLFMVLAPVSTWDKSQAPPAAMGWMFVVIGGVFMLFGLAFAVLVFIAGRSLATRKHYTFCLVIAVIECLFMPLGTVLGVFTLITLLRESVKPLFNTSPPAPPV